MSTRSVFANAGAAITHTNSAHSSTSVAAAAADSTQVAEVLRRRGALMPTLEQQQQRLEEILRTKGSLGSSFRAAPPDEKNEEKRADIPRIVAAACMPPATPANTPRNTSVAPMVSAAAAPQIPRGRRHHMTPNPRPAHDAAASSAIPAAAAVALPEEDHNGNRPIAASSVSVAITDEAGGAGARPQRRQRTTLVSTLGLR